MRLQYLEILSPSNVKVFTMLDPSKFDQKRIEIRVPSYLFKDMRGTIVVRLTSLE